MNTQAKFSGGRNIAMKVPPHQYDAVVSLSDGVSENCDQGMLHRAARQAHQCGLVAACEPSKIILICLQ